MVGKLIEWATHSVVVVLLLVAALTAVGGYAFFSVNVEAYPDPAPAIIEIVAQYPGASAEEMERQVTIPLEVALTGMPGLKYTRAKSMFGLTHLRNQFEYGVDYLAARQEVVNRLSQVNLPNGVTPQISPASPIGEILRYTLDSPKDGLGNEIYTLNDLKALQDWTLQRQFRRVPRVAGVTSSGGTVKRYEILPDPDRLKEYGITLRQLQDAIAGSNANVGGDFVRQGSTIQVVRGIGLIGGGEDPMQLAMQADTPMARQYDKEAEQLEKDGQESISPMPSETWLPLNGLKPRRRFCAKKKIVASWKSAISSSPPTTVSPFASNMSSKGGRCAPTTRTWPNEASSSDIRPAKANSA